MTDVHVPRESARIHHVGCVVAQHITFHDLLVLLLSGTSSEETNWYASLFTLFDGLFKGKFVRFCVCFPEWSIFCFTRGAGLWMPPVAPCLPCGKLGEGEIGGGGWGEAVGGEASTTTPDLLLSSLEDVSTAHNHFPPFPWFSYIFPNPV